MCQQACDKPWMHGKVCTTYYVSANLVTSFHMNGVRLRYCCSLCMLQTLRVDQFLRVGLTACGERLSVQCRRPALFRPGPVPALLMLLLHDRTAYNLFGGQNSHVLFIAYTHLSGVI